MPKFKLKWSDDDPSQAIILTFHSKWEPGIRYRQFSTIFRKMGPRQFIPKTIYAYISKPVSAIIARMSVEEYGYVPVEEALAISEEGAISRQELQLYADGYDQLIVIKTSLIEVATNPIAYERLASEYGYFPSSTFIPLSESGRQVLDSLGCFSSADGAATPSDVT